MALEAREASWAAAVVALRRIPSSSGQTFVIAVHCPWLAQGHVQAPYAVIAIMHAALLFRSQRGCAVYCCLHGHINSVNASATAICALDQGAATGLGEKKSWMDYVWGFIALTCYRTGGRNWDRGGRGGKIGWVRASMRGPTSCHMRTEKQHLIVSSLGRPPEKRGAAEGDKSIPAPSATTRTRPPLPRWPALVFAGGIVNFSCPERRTLSTVFVIQHAGAILLLERWARRYRDSRVQVSQIQNGRSSWAQTRTRKAGCSNLGSLRPDQQLTPYDGPLSGTHSLTYCLKSCRALGATTVQPVV